MTTNPTSQADGASTEVKIAVALVKKNLDVQKQFGNSVIGLIQNAGKTQQMGVNMSKTGGIDMYG